MLGYFITIHYTMVHITDHILLLHFGKRLYICRSQYFTIKNVVYLNSMLIIAVTDYIKLGKMIIFFQNIGKRCTLPTYVQNHF